MCLRPVSADYGEVTRRLESTPGTGSKPFPDYNLKTRPFSYIVVPPQSHKYSLSPGNLLPLGFRSSFARPDC